MAESRVLPLSPLGGLADYEAIGGGAGLDAARRLGTDGVIEHLMASGLRGRGGAGFPTGRKWSTVHDYESPTFRASVVVNAAEGEPGTFKDRTILRRNPFAVVEGALIAAATVDADNAVDRNQRILRRGSARAARRDRRDGARRLDRRRRGRGVRGAQSIPVRRGDGAARGDRRASPVPAGRASVSARTRRGRP